MEHIVGERKVIFFQTLLVPQEETATFVFYHGDDPQKFNINFREDEVKNKEDKLKAYLEAQGSENAIDITFVNWTSPLGMSSRSPINIGKNTENGNKVSILPFVVKMGSLYKIDLQIMEGGKE